MIFQQAPFVNRTSLPGYLNCLGLAGEGVEVGTHRGHYAKMILRLWKGKKLYCVDPWTNPPGYEEQAKYLTGKGDRLKDLEEAHSRLGPFVAEGRAVLLQATSQEALSQFTNGTLDFVYLDGDHRTEQVYLDLCEWWEKVKPGGVLAGHDVVCPGAEGQPDDWGPNIQEALRVFTGAGHRRGSFRRTVYLIVEQLSEPWSFYLRKP